MEGDKVMTVLQKPPPREYRKPVSGSMVRSAVMWVPETLKDWYAEAVPAQVVNGLSVPITVITGTGS